LTDETSWKEVDGELARVVINAWQIHEFHPDEMRMLLEATAEENKSSLKKGARPFRVQSARVLKLNTFSLFRQTSCSLASVAALVCFRIKMS
jgi:hypothetical protein